MGTSKIFFNDIKIYFRLKHQLNRKKWTEKGISTYTRSTRSQYKIQEYTYVGTHEYICIYM